MRGHDVKHREPSLGPLPVLAGGGEVDCSGRFWRTAGGAVVRGGAEQRMIIVRQGNEYAAHCWNRYGTGKSLHAAIEALLRAIDTTTQRDEFVGGLQGVA